MKISSRPIWLPTYPPIVTRCDRCGKPEPLTLCLGGCQKETHRLYLEAIKLESKTDDILFGSHSLLTDSRTMSAMYSIPHSNTTTSGEEKDTVKRVFIFSHPRTTSNVLLNFFAKSNEIAVIDCPFDAAYMAGPEKMCRRDNPTIKSLFRKSEDYGTTYRSAYQKMQERIREIEAEVS